MGPAVLLIPAAIIGLIALASGKKSAAPTPQLPAADTGTATYDTGPVPDAFQGLAETALAIGDCDGAEALAAQAQAKGLLSVARNIRAEIAANGTCKAKSTPSGADKPVAVSAAKRPTIRRGSTGADVIEWQHIIGQKADGIFGPVTDAATRTWQKAHGLVVDGIVGPKTWAAAYAKNPVLAAKPAVASIAPPAVKAIAVQPTWIDWYNGASANDQNTFDKVAHAIDSGSTSAENDYQSNPALYAALVNYRATGGRKALAPAVAKPVTAPTTTGYHLPRNLSKGIHGPDVAAWQKVIGVKADGIFGPATDAATRIWQKAHGLKADGIVGPATWAAIGTAVVTAGVPQAPAPAQLPAAGQSDARTAAQELTDYLTGLGGLAGRGKESKTKVSAWLTRIGTPDPRGYYGRMSARAIMRLGLVPVAPYYWSATTAARDKAEFLALVDDYKAADAPRAAQWTKLRADTVRS